MDPLPLIAAHCAAAGVADVYLVGGRVRDALLGRPTLDTDLVVPAGAAELARDIADALDGTLVVLDEGRDIARVVWRHGGAVLDVARQVGGSLAADLAQRDLTVNALAVPLAQAASPTAEAVIDPTGGLADLASRQLRMTSPAALDADPLRLLRVPRLAAELAFAIEPATRAAIVARADRIAEPAAERVREELLRLLAAPAAAANVADLDALGLLTPLLPELAAGRGQVQSPPHSQDVLGHSLTVLDGAEALQHYITPPGFETTPSPAGRELPPAWRELLTPRRTDLARHMGQDLGGRPRWVAWRLAALLHDVGKPATATTDPDTGRIRFLRHETVGAEMCRQLGHRLRLGGQVTDYLARVVRNHLRPLLLAAEGTPSRRAVYRFYRSAGDTGADTVLLALADNLAKAAQDDPGHLAATAERLLDAWFEARSVVVSPTPLVTGHELIEALGLTPGPEVGRLLALLREAQAAGEVADRDAALELARSLAALSGAGRAPS